MSRFVSRRGAAFVAWARSWWRLLRFAGTVLAAALSPSVYNSATRTVAARQIYFTAWQILPGFTLFAALLGFIIIRIVVSTASEFGLSQHALELIVRVLVLEVIPVLAALFVALRSGSAINTQAALMNVLGEIEALERAGVDPMRCEFVPRVVAAVLSVASLTAVSCAAALALAYLGVYGFYPWGFQEYTRIVGQVFDPQVGFGLALKCLLFGLAVAIIPIAEGLSAPRGLHFAPIAVLRGMMRLFFALALIEVTSLTATYI